MRNKEERSFNWQGGVVGLWIGSIGTVVSSGGMAQALFGIEAGTGLGIWVVILIALTIYGMGK